MRLSVRCCAVRWFQQLVRRRFSAFVATSWAYGSCELESTNWAGRNVPGRRELHERGLGLGALLGLDGKVLHQRDARRRGGRRGSWQRTPPLRIAFFFFYSDFMRSAKKQGTEA